MTAMIKAYYLASALIILFSGCSQKKGEKKELSKPIVLNEKTTYKLSITKLDSLIFRCSVHAPGPISNKEAYRVEHANPILNSIDETQFGLRLKQIGLVNNYELLLSKFKDSEEFILKNESGNILNGKAYYFRPSSLSNRHFRLLVNNNADSAYLDIDEGISLARIKMAVVNFTPGGYPEVAILKKYYIMNGYNYDVLIYEVK